MTDDADQKSAAVYVAWTTFNNTLSTLAKVMPKKIDKSTFTGQSGGVQNQLMAGYKFLGLIAEDGTPLPALQSVAVADEAIRKERIKKVLEQRYAALFALGLDSTTPDQLNSTMASAYKVSGDTKEKAVRFFMSAAEYAGIPISPYLKKAAGSVSSSSRKRRTPGRTTMNGADDDGGENETDTPPPKGTSKTIALKSGGHTLTVSTTAGLFDTGEDDRKFLFDLIDRLITYERANEQAD
jgi:hypothetical protein